MSRTTRLTVLEQQLGHTFSDAQLLRQALTHRSYAANHYERLEFLGDGVLNCGIARCLYDQFTHIKEGELSRIRAHLVKQDTLVLIAQDLNVSNYVLLGEGELKSGGLNRPSILADVVEAMIGAIFLDAGFDAAQAVVAQLYAPLLKTIDPSNAGKDAKTQLQERLQAQKLAVPKYTIIDIQGAAHEQLFTVSCVIDALHIKTKGEGSTRRLAEQHAAHLAISVLDNAVKQHSSKRG